MASVPNEDTLPECADHGNENEISEESRTSR